MGKDSVAAEAKFILRLGKDDGGVVLASLVTHLAARAFSSKTILGRSNGSLGLSEIFRQSLGAPAGMSTIPSFAGELLGRMRRQVEALRHQLERLPLTPRFDLSARGIGAG